MLINYIDSLKNETIYRATGIKPTVNDIVTFDGGGKYYIVKRVIIDYKNNQLLAFVEFIQN